jgi:hypothetical protein
MEQSKIIDTLETYHATPRCAPWWLVATSYVFWPSPEGSSVSYVQKKISKKFCGIWTSFGTDILKNQKEAKNSNWH